MNAKRLTGQSVEHVRFRFIGGTSILILIEIIWSTRCDAHTDTRALILARMEHAARTHNFWARMKNQQNTGTQRKHSNSRADNKLLFSILVRCGPNVSLSLSFTALLIFFFSGNCERVFFGLDCVTNVSNVHTGIFTTQIFVFNRK